MSLTLSSELKMIIQHSHNSIIITVLITEKYTLLYFFNKITNIHHLQILTKCTLIDLYISLPTLVFLGLENSHYCCFHLQQVCIRTHYNQNPTVRPDLRLLPRSEICSHSPEFHRQIFLPGVRRWFRLNSDTSTDLSKKKWIKKIKGGIKIWSYNRFFFCKYIFKKNIAQ